MSQELQDLYHIISNYRGVVDQESTVFSAIEVKALEKMNFFFKMAVHYEQMSELEPNLLFSVMRGYVEFFQEISQKLRTHIENNHKETVPDEYLEFEVGVTRFALAVVNATYEFPTLSLYHEELVIISDSNPYTDPINPRVY